MAGRGVKVLDNDRRRSGRRQRRHHDGQELARQRVPSRGPKQIGGRDGKGRRRPLAVRSLGGGDAVRIGDRQVLLWNRPGPGPCLVTAGIESPKSEFVQEHGLARERRRSDEYRASGYRRAGGIEGPNAICLRRTRRIDAYLPVSGNDLEACDSRGDSNAAERQVAREVVTEAGYIDGNRARTNAGGGRRKYDRNATRRARGQRRLSAIGGKRVVSVVPGRRAADLRRETELCASHNG